MVHVQHLTDPGVSVGVDIIVYKNSADAGQRYLSQENWIFVYDFGVPPSRQMFSYADVVSPIEIDFVADKYRIACLRAFSNMRCSALFLYDNVVILLDAPTVGDGAQHFPDLEFFTIVNAINELIRRQFTINSYQ